MGIIVLAAQTLTWDPDHSSAPSQDMNAPTIESAALISEPVPHNDNRRRGAVSVVQPQYFTAKEILIFLELNQR